MTEKVNHPAHYGGDDSIYECIKVIENWQLCFHLGNVLKYICRMGKKNDDLIDELKKARWYLDRKISLLEKEKAEQIRIEELDPDKSHYSVCVDSFGYSFCPDCKAYGDIALALPCSVKKDHE